MLPRDAKRGQAWTFEPWHPDEVPANRSDRPAEALVEPPSGSRVGVWTGRSAGFVAALVPALVATAVAGGSAGLAAFAAMGLLLQMLRLVLPAAAHAAFTRGDLTAAHRRYRALATLAWLRHRRTAAVVSLAAVELARGELDQAEARLAALDDAALDGDARAACLNNRAMIALRRGHALGEAVALAEAAVALRPDVPGIRHTHALALLAQGQLDAAISAFDELHRMTELPPLLEAERCDDLAAAWLQRGEADYAAEYRERAARARQLAGR